jgi:hypothetical protein
VYRLKEKALPPPPHRETIGEPFHIYFSPPTPEKARKSHTHTISQLAQLFIKNPQHAFSYPPRVIVRMTIFLFSKSL